jgi:probable F420-dependent oxidoreductase
MTLRSFAASDPGSWDQLVERARTLDRAGIDRLVVSDHVVFGERMEAYADPSVGGRTGGQQPTGPDGHWLEPLTVLAAVSTATERIRLGTSILIAALRRPAVLAKTVATLDVLSGGRVDLGVGVGWQREEYDAAGLPFEGRGRLLDHTLEVCQALWRADRASYSSDELAFDGIHAMPKPRQAGGVPIWVSGRSSNRLVRERVARFGSGWIPWGDDADDVAGGLDRIREAMADAGRADDALEVAGTLPVVKGADGSLDLAATMAAVPPLVEVGVTDFRVQVRLPDDEAAVGDQLAALVAAFRAAL